MRGICIKKIDLVHEDERRGIWEIMNGQMSIKNMKILKVKKGSQILGNHWHVYPEVMYIMEGRAHYKMRHVITGETEEFDLAAGDVLFKTGFITHTGLFEEDSVIIDGAAETYIDNNFNDVVERLWSPTL